MRKLWHHWYGKLLIALPIVLVALRDRVPGRGVVHGAVQLLHQRMPRDERLRRDLEDLGPPAGPLRQVPHRAGRRRTREGQGGGLREVYVHFAGEVKAPISVTRHVPDSTCGQSDCHRRRATYDRVVLRDVTTPAGARRPTSAAEAVAPSSSPPPGHPPAPLRRAGVGHAVRGPAQCARAPGRLHTSAAHQGASLHRLPRPRGARSHPREAHRESEVDGVLPAVPRRDTGPELLRDLPHAAP